MALCLSACCSPPEALQGLLRGHKRQDFPLFWGWTSQGGRESLTPGMTGCWAVSRVEEKAGSSRTPFPLWEVSAGDPRNSKGQGPRTRL